MWSAPVVIFLPLFQRLSCIPQCGEQCFVEAFNSQFTVEAFDETVLLGLLWRDVMPINACILNPFEDGHADELGPVTP